MKAPIGKKTFKVVGESYDTKSGKSRQKVLEGVWPGDSVELVREQQNPHDANAILVVIDGEDLGHLSRADAGVLAAALDKGIRHKAQIHEINGGVASAPSYGVRISIAWNDQKLPQSLPLREDQLAAREEKSALPGGCLGLVLGLIALFGTYASNPLLA